MTNLSNNDRTKLDNFNGMTVGNIFQKSRESQNLDLMQISAHLNIGSDHLTAIENNDVAHLPPKVYAVGFVRAYADLLGLDSDKMAYLFKIQVYGKKQTDLQSEIVQSEGKTIKAQDNFKFDATIIPYLIAFLIAAGLLITTIIYIFMWIFSSGSDNAEFRVPEVPPEMMEGAAMPIEDFISLDNATPIAPVEPMDILIKPDEGAKAYGVEALKSALTFKMVDDGWLEIRAIKNGKVLLSETLNSGDVFYLSESQDILLTTNNGASIEAYLDGQKLGLLGTEGDIIRLRPFSVKALRLQNVE